MYDATFLKTDVSASLKSMGFTARDALTLSERLSVQELALQDCIAVYESGEGECVTDRTPLDLIAYTIGEVTMSRATTLASEDPLLEQRLNKYFDDCIQAANKYFKEIVIVQPGIPIVDDIKSAAPSFAYIHHLNLIFLGLAKQTNSIIMPATLTALSGRIVLCRSLFRNSSQYCENMQVASAS